MCFIGSHRNLSHMIAVIQRVSESSVTIGNEVKGKTGNGLTVLLGIGHEDTEEDIVWLSNKIVHLRIFSDAAGKMNRSVKDIAGGILLISQFTLHASTKKGNRPSFTEAAKPDSAIPLYEACIRQLERDLGKPIQTGTFGADMQVALTNDGPVTIIIDTKNRR